MTDTAPSEFERVAFFLPPIEWEKEFLDRCLRHVRDRFGDRFALTLYSSDPAAHADLLSLENGQVLPENLYGPDEQTILVIPNDGSYVGPEASAVYTIDRHAMLRQRTLFRDVLDTWDAEFNTFRRLSDRDPRIGYRYFPYTYNIRRTWGGPVDGFGHRISFDYRDLIGRPKDHIVLAHFGGSTGYSTNCTHDEMYSELIAKDLTGRASKRGLKTHFTSVNFSVVGNTVLDEMTNFLLFCHELRPEFVVAHDGWNDLMMGLVNDPELLSGHQICYLHNLELWAQVLHDSKDTPISNPESPMRLVNYPQSVIEAYIARKHQFRLVAEAHNACFISGLQPAMISKGGLHPAEQAFIDKGGMDPALKQCFDKAPQLFEMTAQALEESGEKFLYLHAKFARYDESDWLFDDRVHMTARGEVYLARHYADHIAALLWDETQQED